MKKQSVSPDNVFKFVLDKALEEYLFCSVKDVKDEFNISKPKSRQLLNSLVKEGKLMIVHDNPRFKVYAPAEIIRNIVQQQIKPKWLKKYPLPNKDEHLKKKAKLDKALTEYEKFEGLLYLKDKALEEPARFTFKWLGFDVKKLPEGEFADFEIYKNRFSGAVEVSGGKSGCPMDKVRQLYDYFCKTLEREKRKIPHLLLLFNHFYNTDLKERAKKKAFEKEVREGAKRSGITLATTVQLYEKIKRIKAGKSTKEQVAKEIMEGKWN